MLRRFLIPLFIALTLASVVGAGGQQPNYYELTLLTTNDLHANLVPFDHLPILALIAPQVKDVGGAARRATIVNRARAQSRGYVLLLDSGDTTFGWSPLAKAFHGAADVDVMNAMRYDAMEPGNHEFQWPSVDTLRNLKASHFPWVCANLVEEKTGKLFLPPYVIREIGGVRVAFLGLMTLLVNSDPYKAARELGLKAVDPIETARKLVPEIRQKADVVILLSHLGVKLDQQLAKGVPGIDIILGGHTHTRLPHPILVPVGTPTATSLGAVPVVQAFMWGSEMGRTQVIFHRDPATGAYSLMSCKGELVSIDNTLPDDPVISQLIQCYQAKMPVKPAPAPTPAPAPQSN